MPSRTAPTSITPVAVPAVPSIQPVFILLDWSSGGCLSANKFALSPSCMLFAPNPGARSAFLLILSYCVLTNPRTSFQAPQKLVNHSGQQHTFSFSYSLFLSRISSWRLVFLRRSSSRSRSRSKSHERRENNTRSWWRAAVTHCDLPCTLLFNNCNSPVAIQKDQIAHE